MDACCFTSDVWPHPSRRAGHLRLPKEAESGSLAYGSRVRPDTPALLAVLTLVRLLAEQAIYMVNSFQSTGSARLILATDRKGADDFVALKLFDPPCQPKCLRPSARWNSRSRTDWDLRAEDGRP